MSSLVQAFLFDLNGTMIDAMLLYDRACHQSLYHLNQKEKPVQLNSLHEYLQFDLSGIFVNASAGSG